MSEIKKFELTPSLSILLAGVIIAGAILVTNGRAAATAPPDDQLPTTTTNVRAPSAGDHIIGSPDAKIVLIEYSDFQCPFCSRVDPTLKQIVQEGKGDIAWVYRHLPLESIHPQARPAALASECVAEQLGNSGFWQFADRIFADQSKMSAAYYVQVAGELGADKAKFNACVAADTYASRIDADIQEAMQNGGQGTPYTVVYTKKKQAGVSGALPYELFMSVINQFK